nr:translation initiation factor IF-2-like [Equus asinus]
MTPFTRLRHLDSFLENYRKIRVVSLRLRCLHCLLGGLERGLGKERSRPRPRPRRSSLLQPDAQARRPRFCARCRPCHGSRRRRPSRGGLPAPSAVAPTNERLRKSLPGLSPPGRPESPGLGPTARGHGGAGGERTCSGRSGGGGDAAVRRARLAAQPSSGGGQPPARPGPFAQPGARGPALCAAGGKAGRRARGAGRWAGRLSGAGGRRRLRTARRLLSLRVLARVRSLRGTPGGPGPRPCFFPRAAGLAWALGRTAFEKLSPEMGRRPWQRGRVLE